MATKKIGDTEVIDINQTPPAFTGALYAIPDVQKEIKPAREAVVKLIVRMCDDVLTGRARDEYKTCEVLADLMNSIK